MMSAFRETCVVFSLIFLFGNTLSQEGNSQHEMERGFIFTVPKMLVVNTTEMVCLTLFNLTDPYGQLRVTLYKNDNTTIISSMSHYIRKESHCYELFMPMTKQEKGVIGVEAQFHNYPDYKVDSKKEIRFQISSHRTFIQTDKPIYHPGHQVKFRLLSLHPDLKPVTDDIDEIYIEDPHGIRLAQWRNIGTKKGMADMSFQLTHETVKGTWKITALVKNGKFFHDFVVDDYILPRFSVKVIPPPFILNDVENFTMKICAKYTYGMPVDGNYTLEIFPFMRSFLRTNNKPFLTLEGMISGCIENVITATSMGMNNETMAPHTLFIKASVTEAGTGKVENTTTNVDISFQALKLDILAPKNFKPGMTFHGEVLVSDLGNTPAPNTLIEVCVTLVSPLPEVTNEAQCGKIHSNAEGRIPFIIPPQHLSVSKIRIKAVAVEYEKKLYQKDLPWFYIMQQPSRDFESTAWYSPSYSFIRVTPVDKGKIRCGEELQAKVEFTTTEQKPIMFHYLILSRGNILNWKQRIHEAKQRHHLDDNDHGIILGRTMEVRPDDTERFENKLDEPIPDDLLIGKFNIRFNIIPEMSDSLHLLVYYIRNDGEVVAETVTMDTEPCFNNKVTLQAERDRVLPGDEVKIKISSAAGSICALSAVDKNIHLLGNEKPIDAQTIFHYIRSYNLGKENQPVQTSGREECKTSDFPFPSWSVMRRKRSFFRLFPSPTYIDSLEAFNSAGLTVISDVTLSTKPCIESPTRFLNDLGFPEMLFDKLEITAPKAMLLNSVDTLVGEGSSLMPSKVTSRDYFPETWLWDLITPDDDGEKEIVVNIPDSITTWKQSLYCVSDQTGFGVSPPVDITAFQPFFVDFSTPYSIKRGETMVLKVSVFNYLEEDLPIELELEGSSDFMVVGPMIVQTCLKAGKGHVLSFSITPKILGKLNITMLAAVAPDYPKQCGPEFLLGNIRDRVVKSVMVEPEGFPIEKTESDFFCLQPSSDPITIEWGLTLPEEYIDGSEHAWFALTGDLLGPALNGLQSLVRMPTGCGEQNMVLFTPNIFVLKYLRSINHLTEEMEANILKNLEAGYQRQLNYKHPDGSYSAFGTKDEVGSIWLTAFVVKSFAQAKEYILIDKKELDESMKFITRRQLENGCFPVVGMVHQKNMKGGLGDQSVLTPLTAYILISLMESGVMIPADVLTSGWYCLKADRKPTVYTQALSAYAFALGRRSEASVFMDNLLNSAKSNSAMMWWQITDEESSSVNIEVTAYCVLTMITLRDAKYKPFALKAVRWIASQGNGNGGFISTQDTVLALQALAYYSSQLSLKNSELHVDIQGLSLERALSVISNGHEDNRFLQQKLIIPELPTPLRISITGHGCGLVQASLKYHVPETKGKEAFTLRVWDEKAFTVEPCLVRRMHVCVAYTSESEPSNMVIIEVHMVSGYTPEKSELESLTNDVDIDLSRWEINGNTLALYFKELTGEDKCFSFIVSQEVVVLDPKPGRIAVYDYYQSEKRVEMKYNFKKCETEQNIIELPEVMSAGMMLPLESFEDMDFPEGDPSLSVVVAMPPDGFPSGKCPLCLDQFPVNMDTLFCDSPRTIRASVLSPKQIRLVHDISTSRKQPLKKKIPYRLPKDCSCPQLSKGSSLVILNFPEESLSDEDPVLKLREGIIVVKINEEKDKHTFRLYRNLCRHAEVS